LEAFSVELLVATCCTAARHAADSLVCTYELDSLQTARLYSPNFYRSRLRGAAAAAAGW